MDQQKLQIVDFEKRMSGAIDALKKELSGLRTGRASISLLEPVRVEAYGGMMALSQVANVSAPESRMLVVQVWDREMAKPVEKAIRDAGLGVNPIAEGQVIRVPLPDLTEERRKELAKVCAKYGEGARIAVRNVRRDGMDGLKKAEKDKIISEDEHHRLSQELQKLTDKKIQEIDQIQTHKEKEIMQI
jgi:ribosome recycling factor